MSGQLNLVIQLVSIHCKVTYMNVTYIHCYITPQNHVVNVTKHNCRKLIIMSKASKLFYYSFLIYIFTFYFVLSSFNLIIFAWLFLVFWSTILSLIMSLPFHDQIARDFHFDFCFHLRMEINTFSMKTLMKDH